MLFTSSIFLYAFLPATLTIFLLLGRLSKATWPILGFLIVTSFIFYGYQNPYNIILLVSSITINFAAARIIRKGIRPAVTLFFGIFFNLALLAYFKYTNFFLDNVGALSGQSFDLLDITLPLAISFYTFQQIAYLVDVKTGQVRDVSFRNYLLFVTFFPQLIIGPIVHHSEMMPQFSKDTFGKIKWSDFHTGAFFLFSGIIKKLFIADPLGAYVDTIHTASAAGEPVTLVTAWLSAFAFSMQIYFDFSGYTDMAIGLAKLFGIDLPLNFNSPYKSRNFSEFWRRWHMTLSRWLRDYLYIPLGGNRHGFTRLALCAFVVFILGGLWHGAAWTFVLWGLMHGVGVTVSHGMGKLNFPIPKAIAIALTFTLVTLSWVIFRAESFSAATTLYKAMFTFDGSFSLPMQGPPYAVLGIAALTVFLLPNTQTIIPRIQNFCVNLPKPAIVAVIIIFWLSLSAFDLDSSAEFIYFDF